VDGAAAAVAAPSPPAVPLSALGRELELVRQAAFTEPDDQSPWFYRRWCVAEACRHVGAGGEAEAAALALLAEDCAHLRELAEAEPGCKCEFELEAGG
jgi:geranylgeranyl transferase type-2 subunit alpha